MIASSEVTILNRRLFERLGSVCGGSLPRFSWKYAPEELWITYSTDDRTLLRKTWADMAAPDGGTLGRVWVLAQWGKSKVFDHHGFGDGARIPFVREWGYQPYVETALAPGHMPDAAITQQLMWLLDRQLAASAEHKEGSFENYMGDEAWISRKNEEREKMANRERAAAEYDKYTGAFGNLEPGRRAGFISFENNESGDGFFQSGGAAT